jgi:Tol biopolymer transport system component
MCRAQHLTIVWLFGLVLTGCGGSTEPGNGTLEVTSLTVGEPTDPDGYSLAVDGDQGRPFATNATLTISDLPAGDHELQLLGVAPHCTLTGESPRTVTLTAGNVTRTTFEVQCSSPTGSIEVTTTTTGESPDPDGYSVALDGGAGQPVETNGAISFTAVIAGDHLVQLTGAAPNCAVGGMNPRSVAVGTDVATTVFEITCHPPTGTIKVSTTTGGLHLDPDGYTVSLDGGPGQPVGTNGTLTVPNLPVGDHTLQVSGLATNCSLVGDNPLTVAVTEEAPVQVALQVNCLGLGTSTLLFASDRTGTSRLYRIEDDGSGVKNLTPAITAYDGDWSPEGSKIVFNASSGIRVMNADGSGSVGLGVDGEAPKWSPDGSKIVFESGGSIRVMNANGSNIDSLTTGHRPDWSPDGTQIAFDRINPSGCVLGICPSDLYVMQADGSQVQLLIDHGACAAWSPDGSKIAYSSLLVGIFVMNANGTGSTQIAGGGSGCPVVWSPDGAAIAYQGGQSNGTSELIVSPSTGGSGAAIASSPASEFPESWK